MATENITKQGTVTPAGVVNFDPNTGTRLTPGISVPVVPGGNTYGSTPVTIVTSNLSKTNYADNTATLNTVNNNLKQTAANNPSVVDMLNLNGMPSDFASRTRMAANLNIPNYTGTAQQNTQILDSLRTQNGSGAGGSRNSNVGQDNNNNANNTTMGNGTTTTTTNKNAPAPVTTTNSDGSTFVTGGDGSTTLSYGDGSSFTIPAGMDVGLAKAGYDNERQLAKASDTAKSIMDSAAALMNDDPAARAAADSIKQQYDTLIQQMRDKNAMLLGSYAKNGARSGMLQYANEMNTNYQSMEFDKATERVADLVAKQTKAISDSNAAFKSGNVKAFAAAAKDYEESLKATNTAINTLQDNISAVIKQNATDIKNAEITHRQQQADSFKASIDPNASRAIADAIAANPGQKDAIFKSMAEQLGITEPADLTRLAGAVDKSGAVQATEATTLAQKKKTLNKVAAGKGTKPYASFTKPPTAANVSKVNAYLVSKGLGDADIKAANANEATFYAVLNKIPAKGGAKFK